MDQANTFLDLFNWRFKNLQARHNNILKRGGDQLSLKKSRAGSAIIPKVAFSYAGAIVGAGFTSGQELMQFFVNLRSGHIPALILTTVLFAVFGWAALHLSRVYRSADYGSFLKCLLGSRAAQVFDGLISFFLLGTLGIMMSAAGAVFAEHLGGSFQIGVALLSFGIGLVLLSKVQGVFWLNTILMPAKFILVLIVGGLIMLSPGFSFAGSSEAASLYAEPITQSWFLASLLYVAYNLILGLAVLTSLGAVDLHPKLSWAGIWGGLGLGVFAGIIVAVLADNWPAVTGYQVPMLFLAGQVHPGIGLVYTLVLGMGILTTGVACAYALTVRVQHWLKRSYNTTLLLILILALPLAPLGFARLVHIVYPLFGLAGIILLACLAWRTIDSLVDFGH